MEVVLTPGFPSLAQEGTILWGWRSECPVCTRQVAMVFGKGRVVHFRGGEESTKRRVAAAWKSGGPSTRFYTVGGSGHEHSCTEGRWTRPIEMSKSPPLGL